MPDSTVPPIPEQPLPTPTAELIRHYREMSGLTQLEAATLAGISQASMSRYERGLLPVPNMQVWAGLAHAFKVPPQLLAGQPVVPRTPRESVFLHLAADLRAALDGETAPPRQLRPLGALAADVLAVEAAGMANDWDTVSAKLPGLLTELPLVADREDAALLHVRALMRATLAMHLAGYVDLARLCATHAQNIALDVGDPVHVAAGSYALAQAAYAGGSRQLSLRVIVRALETLAGTAAEQHGMWGMLTLHGSLVAGSLGQAVRSAELLAEAETLARQPRESFNLKFGPENVGVWKASIAAESGNWDQVVPLAQQVPLTALDTADRRARLLVEMGRGYFQTGAYQEAMSALVRALRVSPDMTRVLTCVRECTAQLMPRLPGSDEYSELVSAVGVAAAEI